MKKRIFTLLIAVGAFAFANAQTLVDFDNVKSTSLGGWMDTIHVAKNPSATGLNTTDSCVKAVAPPANWWQTEVNFKGLPVGTYTGIEFLVYVDSTNPDIELGGLTFSGFTGVGDPTKAIISTGKTWVKMEYELQGVTATDSIKNFIVKPHGTGSTNVAYYFDEIKLNNFTYSPEQQTARLTTTAVKISEDMELDGLDNEAIYDDVDLQKIEVVNSGSSTGIGGEFGLMWDDTYLYAFIKIEDNTTVKCTDAGFADAWKGDGVQIYMDALNRRYTGVVNGITGAQVIPLSETSAAITAGFGTTAAGFGLDVMDGNEILIKQASIASATGYSIELAWPWTGIISADNTVDSAGAAAWVTANVKKGMKFSFDIQLNDKPTASGNRTNMLSWCSTPKEPYGNSGTWGEVTLTVPGEVATKDVTASDARIYPNPASESITVKMEGMNMVTIFDLTGREVVSKVVDSNVATINVNELISGIYMVKVSSSDGTSFQKVNIR